MESPQYLLVHKHPEQTAQSIQTANPDSTVHTASSTEEDVDQLNTRASISLIVVSLQALGNDLNNFF